VVVRHERSNPAVSALRIADQQAHVDLGGSSLLNTIASAFFAFVREVYSPRREKDLH